MLNKFSKIPDFSGHNVYVGLDVHKASWAVNILVDDIEHRHFTQPPSPLVLFKYLTDNFPGADYFSAYECGFSGYHHHRELLNMGIRNIVFNPDHEQFRSLFRMRWNAAKENRRVKNRIRSFLHYYGIIPPDTLNPDFWSLAFLSWLKELKLPTEAGTLALEYLLIAYQNTRSQLLQVTRQLRHELKLHYQNIYKRLLTIPGIGPINALCLIAEIGDIDRFRSCKHLASFVGIMTRHY